jgi:hypothetical protein
MGSIMSAISDDIDTYEALCAKYGEQVQHDHHGPDCYGKHAIELKARALKESKIDVSMSSIRTRFNRDEPV